MTKTLVGKTVNLQATGYGAPDTWLDMLGAYLEGQSLHAGAYSVWLHPTCPGETVTTENRLKLEGEDRQELVLRVLQRGHVPKGWKLLFAINPASRAMQFVGWGTAASKNRKPRQCNDHHHTNPTGAWPRHW
jgi:hypothetical protein